VHHCPFCDAWEYRGRRLVALGRGSKAIGLARMLRTWSAEVLVCTHGSRLSRGQASLLEQLEIRWRREPIARLIPRGRQLSAIEFARGKREHCAALFFNTGQVQRSRLPFGLGCRASDKGGVRVDRHGRTGVPGLFLAGDALKDVQFVITAAADGA